MDRAERGLVLPFAFPGALRGIDTFSTAWAEAAFDLGFTGLA
jgi:hypothetical protein